MAISIQRRLSKERQKRIDDEAAEEARAQEEIEAEGAAEVETIGKTWGLSPEEVGRHFARQVFASLYQGAAGGSGTFRKTASPSSDHYGRQRINPAVVIEKDSMAGQMRILKQLNIGPEAPEPAGKDGP